MKVRLKELKKQKLDTKPRVLLYGTEGVGKSTLASGSGNPIFLDLEGGTSQLSIARYPFPNGTPEKFSEVIDAVSDIYAQKHDYTTLVIDTIDRLEGLIWDHVCLKASAHGKRIENIEAFGYGKGYVLSLQETKNFCTTLEGLRSKGMTVVLLGHSMIRNFKNPEGDDYDRFCLRLHDKSASYLKEWSDVVAFMRFESGASKLPGENRAKGYSTGKRFVHLQRTAAYDAKSRYETQDSIEIKGPEDWRRLCYGDNKKATDTPF